MDVSFFVLLGLTLGLAAFAAFQDARLLGEAARATGRLLRSVWVELALGFMLAGLVDVLVPTAQLVKWLGAERAGRGILVAWGAGLLIPGGPYVLFPLMASLFGKGVAAGPLIALISAKTLVSPIRMLTYEAPLLGWPMTLARFVPGVLVPPLLGVVGQWLFDLLSRPAPG
ncbi:MAG TPA: permease [Polyangiaceae bacterium]|nr:permease [Polyangiaceae bacterium]